MSELHLGESGDFEPEEKKSTSGPRMRWPVFEFPGFRTTVAIENKCADNFLFVLWGGIGDQICSEPTLRYALEQFKTCKVSLATDYPELFAHLPFHEVFNTKLTRPDPSKYLVLKTIAMPTDLSWQFMSHCITHCVDYPALCALRCQLPVSYRSVQLQPREPKESRLLKIAAKKRWVLVHAGKHWQSKTFPVEFWNGVLDSIAEHDFVPVLVGKNVDDNVGYVDCSHPQAIDLRDQTTLNDTTWLCQQAPAVICSDSSPLHMAVTGNAHIAFICSAKHQDYIYHWRKDLAGDVKWAWRMKHFNSGGMWDILKHCPNQQEEQVVDKVDPEILKTWLPKPEEMIKWISQQL